MSRNPVSDVAGRSDPFKTDMPLMVCDQAPHHSQEVVDGGVLAKAFDQCMFSRLVVNETDHQFGEPLPKVGEGNNLRHYLKEVYVCFSGAVVSQHRSWNSTKGVDWHSSDPQDDAPTIDEVWRFRGGPPVDLALKIGEVSSSYRPAGRMHRCRCIP